MKRTAGGHAMQSQWNITTPRRRLTRASYRRRDGKLVLPEHLHESDLSLYVEEAVTRRLVEDVVEEVRELRDRMTNLLFLIAGSVFVDVLTRIGGR
jgi:hypothetical protein